MTEQEKRDWVIEGLKCVAETYKFYMHDLATEAIDLLKAQEPVKPTIDIRHGKSMWRCGSCATALQPNQIHTKFCFNCGKAVKWE